MSDLQLQIWPVIATFSFHQFHQQLVLSVNTDLPKFLILDFKIPGALKM